MRLFDGAFTRATGFNGTSTKTRIETSTSGIVLSQSICFNGTSTKTRIETRSTSSQDYQQKGVLMEHPPKQGLKPCCDEEIARSLGLVLMEHPPKQGLKRRPKVLVSAFRLCFNGTSTKTRIET